MFFPLRGHRCFSPLRGEGVPPVRGPKTDGKTDSIFYRPLLFLRGLSVCRLGPREAGVAGYAAGVSGECACPPGDTGNTGLEHVP